MSASALDLVREDLRDFGGYASARREAVAASIHLDANENPWPNAADAAGRCRRYPAAQSMALRDALADLHGVAPARLLPCRGSDEAIDLLVRALCRPGRDAVIISTPTFGMYAISARLHGAPVIDVPLCDGAGGFSLDIPAVITAARRSEARLVFVCSPGNPTGHGVRPADLAMLAAGLAGKAAVVVDEAYGEFSSVASALALLASHDNLLVLRTLSKAHALAGARVGCVIGDPALVGLLGHCQAPYPLATPAVELALAALAPAARERTEACVRAVCIERERMTRALGRAAGVRRVHPSQGNFLLVRFAAAADVWRRLLAAGVQVRDQRGVPGLADALRISVGTREENDRVLRAIGAAEQAP
ncbi:histidinol-phosphate transaminase [Dokdonella sp.]|uniref:histidinol-phosphate transaminase n=1 Tax=Dokdonella sp. TaxID=2291710 RepID=UPI0031C4A579|nr:histidinol-phosphate transaminase [Dokdonella sp.]